MHTEKIPKNVLDDLRSRGHDDQAIEAMTPEEAFSEFCEWNGLSHWADTLIAALDSLRAAAKPSKEED